MKLLILHASAGAGHRRAAEALAVAGGRAGLDVCVRDILDFAPPLFRKTYAQGYLNVVRAAPELWGYMYARTDRKSQQPWQRRIRTFVQKINTLALLRFFDRYSPDAVICTHFMPLEILGASRRRKRRQAPLFGAVTDFAVHSLWMASDVACYYVANREAQRQLIRRGQPADRVRILGIPIDPVFAERTPPAEARARLGLDPRLPVVLMLGGGFGVGSMVDLVRSFKGCVANLQLVAIAGNNARMRKKASEAAGKLGVPATVLGYVGNVHEWMDAAEYSGFPGDCETVDAEDPSSSRLASSAAVARPPRGRGGRRGVVPCPECAADVGHAAGRGHDAGLRLALSRARGGFHRVPASRPGQMALSKVS